MNLMRRILVVDDNKLVRSMLQDILVHAGYEATSAEGVEPALVLVKDWKPDLIITDYYMEGLHGDSFVKMIRDSPPHIASLPIIGLAGTAESEKKLRDAGVDEYIAKPFMKKALLKSVAAYFQEK